MLVKMSFEKVSTIDLVPGRVCNLKCKHCYAASFAGGGHGDYRLMDTDSIINVVNNLVKCGTTTLDFAGGEPTMKFNLLLLAIREFKSRSNNGYCGLITNGTFLTKERLNQLKQAGLDNISISFEGATQQTDDFVRGKGHFQRAVRAAELVKQAGFDLGISITVNKMNKHEAGSFVRFAESLGADGLMFQIIEPRGRAPHYWKELGISVVEGLESLLMVFRRYSLLHIEVPGPLLYRDFLNTFFNAGIPIDDKRCPGGRRGYFVSSGGDIAPCPLYAYILKRPTFSITGPNPDIDEIVRGYDQFSEAVDRMGKRFERCKSCRYALYCTKCPFTDENDVEECEWLSRKWAEMIDAIRQSEIELKIKPTHANGKLIFNVKTQNNPLYVHLSAKELYRMLDIGVVEDIIQSRILPLTDEEVIKFLCKLRSHGVIQISEFWNPHFAPLR